MEIIMNKAILKAVTQFVELKSDKNYKLSSLVKLCEDYIAAIHARYGRNHDISESEFYSLFGSFSAKQLEDISAGIKTYKDCFKIRTTC